jgi:site-specific DNA-cytosine methylase
MNILSLFDGISCGQVAFDKLGVTFDKMYADNGLNTERERESSYYFASEIKPIAIKCATENYPNTIEIGDVTKIHYENGVLFTEKGKYKTNIDMIIGGSPCQSFSFSGKMVGMITKDKIEITTLEQYLELKEDGFEFEGFSYIFWEYVRLLKEIKPKYFLLENVKMAEKWEKVITKALGVNSIYINSDLVSYQHRRRLYWTNIPNVKIPQDRNINFQDYIDNNLENLKESKLNKTPSREKMWNNGEGYNGLGTCHNITNSDKVYCLTRKQDRSPNSGLVKFEDFCRFLTRNELEQAQTLPIGYTKCLSYNQMQDVCGDGWTVDVISHILSNLPKEFLLNKFNN